MAVTDITERKRAEEALQTIHRKLNILSGITRHDINNQLITILGFLGLAKKGIADPVVRDFLEQGEKAAQIIGQQIEFTKKYEKIGVHAPQWQDVTACLAAIRPTLPLGKITISVSLDALFVYADPMFEKVFSNLIDNSLRYGGEAMTTIRISSHEKGAGLVVVVEDNGAGIEEETKKRLFERGFGKHTGFGLFLSREILSITGITITGSGEPGKGTRFEIHVPKGCYRHGNRYEDDMLQPQKK
jgi:signal transduction histidine kinase